MGAKSNVDPAAARKQKILQMIKKQGVTIILVAGCLFAGSFNETFFTIANLMNILRQITVVGIVACGITMLFIAGQTDLAPGSVIALTGVVAAKIVVANGTAGGIITAIAAALGTGLICGLISGIVLAKYRLPAFIITLAVQIMARGAALVLADGKPIPNLPKAYKFIGQGSIKGIPVPILIFLVVILITWFVMYRTRWGRYMFAMGGNEQAAVAAGINVKGLKLGLMLSSGFLSAVSGIILSARIASGQPATAVGYEFDAMTMVVLGGTSLTGGSGSLYGTIIGALIIGVMTNVMNLFNVNAYFQQIIKGLIILAAILIDAEAKNAKNP